MCLYTHQKKKKSGYFKWKIIWYRQSNHTGFYYLNKLVSMNGDLSLPSGRTTAILEIKAISDKMSLFLNFSSWRLSSLSKTAYVLIVPKVKVKLRAKGWLDMWQVRVKIVSNHVKLSWNGWFGGCWRFLVALHNHIEIDGSQLRQVLRTQEAY